MRLDAFLSTYSTVSRRHAQQVIKQGLVTVNHQPIFQPGTRINSQQDRICFRNQLIKPQKEFVYIMVNKPVGYVTTTHDPHQTRIVMNLLPQELRKSYRLFPVGRLDKLSEGLLLITNDGNLTNILTHPTYTIEKEYHVHVNGILSNHHLQQLQQGIVLEDGVAKVKTVKIITTKTTSSLVKIILCEGRKRQIRRMFEHLGLQVMKLQRVRIGTIQLGNLPCGNYQVLDPTSVQTIKRKPT